MTAIRGRTSREMSAAVEATAPADGESDGSEVIGIVWKGAFIGHLARIWGERVQPRERAAPAGH